MLPKKSPRRYEKIGSKINRLHSLLFPMNMKYTPRQALRVILMNNVLERWPSRDGKRRSQWTLAPKFKEAMLPILARRRTWAELTKESQKRIIRDIIAAHTELVRENNEKPRLVSNKKGVIGGADSAPQTVFDSIVLARRKYSRLFTEAFFYCNGMADQKAKGKPVDAGELSLARDVADFSKRMMEYYDAALEWIVLK